MTEKRGMKALEAWCRKVTTGYRDVKINNMTTAWRDGLAFCAIIHHFQPDLIDFDSLSKDNIFQNNDLAFSMAERLGIPALLDAEDMVSYKVPDKLSILTYVSQLYQHFHSLEPPSPAKRPLEVVNDDTTDVAESPEKRTAIDVPSASFTASSKSPFLPRSDVCQACKNRVYILERLIVDNKLYHRTCFKCLKCRTVLSPGSYVECDQLDQYECIQCPAPDEKSPQKRLGEAVLKRFSGAPNGLPAAEQSVPQKTSGFPSLEEALRPSIIAAANAKARSRFHDQNLNNVESGNSDFLNTGQSLTDASPQQPSDQPNEPLLDATSSSPKPDNRDASSVEIASLSETGPSSHHPSALPSEALPSVETSVGEDYADVSSDVRNNNVKTPLPPDGGAQTNDHPAKPALPQKPALAERPRFLPIRRPNQAKATMAESEAPDLSDDGRTSVDSHPSKPLSEITPPEARNFTSECRLEPKTSPFPRNSDLDGGAESRKGSRCEVDSGKVEKPDAGYASADNVQTSRKSDSTVPVGAERPVPVAAPRASRAKRQQAQVPQQRETHAVPVPPKRQAAPAPKDGSGEVPTPSKPPRQILAAEEVTESGEAAPGAAKEAKRPQETASRDSGYPLELNPFGEDNEEATAETQEEPKKKKASLNPFGDSDEEGAEEREREVPKAPEPVQRRLVPCYVNPFSSDSDEDSESSSRFSASPVTSLRKAAPSPLSAPSPRSSTAETSAAARKKRPAPKPPSLRSTAEHGPPGAGSATSSPGITPQTTPRSTQRNSALPARKIPLGGEPGETRFLTEKSLKELDNMNRTKATQESVLPEQSPLSPDSLDSQSEQSTPLSQNRPANTFGNWKKKKRRAPPLPIPRRRQIATISIKDIQAELLEIEEKQLELETQGVQIEKSIREKFNDEIDPSVEEEDLILQLFDLVNKKNELFRRQTELTYLKRQQRLEEEHADLEFQIRCLMEKPDDKKTDEDRALEDQLIARLVEVVTQRSEIIESMEMDRVREAEEDQSLHQQQHFGLQFCSSNRGSMSSQGSLGGGSGVGAQPSSSSPTGKDKSAKKKAKEKKKKKSHNKAKDEDKDTDETETKKKMSKDKKKKWF